MSDGNDDCSDYLYISRFCARRVFDKMNGVFKVVFFFPLCIIITCEFLLYPAIFTLLLIPMVLVGSLWLTLCALVCFLFRCCFDPPAPISQENAQQQQSTHQLSVPMGSDDVRTTIDTHTRATLGRILKPVEDEYSLPTPDTDISPTLHACLDTDETVPVKSMNEESDTDCHHCALEEQQTYTQPPIVLSADFGDNEVLAIEELACTICLIEYQHGDEIQRNGFSDMSKSCDHIFHPECITIWIRSSYNAKCPCCRRPFLVPTPPV
jgi:Ring finger domain